MIGIENVDNFTMQEFRDNEIEGGFLPPSIFYSQTAQLSSHSFDHIEE